MWLSNELYITGVLIERAAVGGSRKSCSKVEGESCLKVEVKRSQTVDRSSSVEL